jgi:hypothetical protein
LIVEAPGPHLALPPLTHPKLPVIPQPTFRKPLSSQEPHPPLYNPLRLYANKFAVPAGTPVRTLGVAISLSLAHNAAAVLDPSSARKYAPNPAICAAAIEVPEKVTTAVLEAIPREGICCPGAKISTSFISDDYIGEGLMLWMENVCLPTGP